MLTRFATLFLVFALGLTGCKKLPAVSKNTSDQSPSPSATPSASGSVTAAATPSAAPVIAKPAIDQNAEVVIFGYHRFVNTVKRPDTEITPAAFEAQMQELKNKNIAVIHMQDFLAWRRGEKAIPSKSAIITLDDGWKSQYEVAWPILKKFNYPVTLFIYTEGIRPGHFSGGESMTWEMLAEMRDAGADIQDHTATHSDLRKPYDKIAKKKLSPEEYEQWLDKEINGSKQMIEQKLGVKVNCFAVPYGFHNDHIRDVCMKAGYEALFTVYGQPITYHTPLASVGRYLMEANKPKVFSDAVAAIATTAVGPSVAEVAPTNLQTQPADGETIKTALPLIKANIGSLGVIDQGSVEMRVSGLGKVDASFDPKSTTVAYQVTQRLKDKTCTVIVSAKSEGKKVETHWTFNISEEGTTAAPPAPMPSVAPSTPAPTAAPVTKPKKKKK
ncbi:MAG TPA: polysaccharide deacetylase family protein [Chthoniobacterales bacterium]|jgi:peptidoglycan/xylan/chitin deacetylase (PgdA/CDA1 family)|nr:polysaccharide deacetylase family protein [Chthoniobacterales bacterium]